MLNYLYEIDAYNPDTTLVETLRFSTQGYVTKPTDTPANTEYKALVIKAGGFASYMFGNARTEGASTSGYGEFVVANDRSLDSYLGYGFDRRGFRVYSVTGTRSAYNSATLIFSGLVDSVEFSWSEIRFNIRSPLAYLQEQAAVNVFAGTNGVSTTAYEGDENLKGQIKPFVYGKVFNITPPLVNRTSLLYIVNFDASGNPAPVHSIPAVRDGEVELTYHDDLATIADLVAHSAASGQYCTCLAKGAFVIHTEPTYVLTCDVVEKSSDADMTPAQLVSRLISDRSPDLSLSDLDGISTLDTAISAVEGIYVNDNSSLLSCSDQLLNPLGCSLIGKVDGSLSFVRLEEPATSAATFTEASIYKEGFDLVDTSGVPYWKFSIGHTKNYTIQDEGSIAGAAITSGRVEFSKLEYRYSEDSDSALKTAYLASGVYQVESLLTDEADAETEAARQLALRGTYRRIWDVPTTGNTILDLGTTITLQLDAYGMENGWDGVIIGYEYDFGSNQVTYQVFG